MGDIYTRSYVELPAHKTVIEILKIGGKLSSSNAYVSGLKGVFWLKDGVTYFTPLTPEAYNPAELKNESLRPLIPGLAAPLTPAQIAVKISSLNKGISSVERRIASSQDHKERARYERQLEKMREKLQSFILAQQFKATTSSASSAITTKPNEPNKLNKPNEPDKLDKLGKCLTPDSLIHLADGTKKPLIELKEGDYVLSLNQDSGLRIKDSMGSIQDST
ncbi:MAG: hypothetical protein KJ569_08110, partial [Candidatus Omnitrophica bacterium]|nr:hypothetical protein [Candidatus Omnitrophota bacterium]